MPVKMGVVIGNGYVLLSDGTKIKHHTKISAGTSVRIFASITGKISNIEDVYSMPNIPPIPPKEDDCEENYSTLDFGE